MSRYFRILSAVLAAALCAATLHAQQNPPQISPPAPPPALGPLETRIFDVKFVDVNILAGALSVFGAQINPSPQLHVLSVRAPKEIMPAIADAIQRLDVPPTPPPPSKNVELIIYIVNATDQPENAPVPAPLQPVIAQLRNILSYKGFQVIDTQVVRGMDGRSTSTSGHMPSAPKPATVGAETPPPSTYNFSAIFRVRGRDKEAAVFLENMKFGVQVPNFDNGHWQYYNVGINSEIELPRGQQVVVGKTTVGEHALILVMSAKILD